MNKIRSDETVDATELAPPMPLLQALRALNTLRSGQVLRVLAMPGQTVSDFIDFSKQTGNPLQTQENDLGQIEISIQKR